MAQRTKIAVAGQFLFEGVMAWGHATRAVARSVKGFISTQVCVRTILPDVLGDSIEPEIARTWVGAPAA